MLIYSITELFTYDFYIYLCFCCLVEQETYLHIALAAGPVRSLWQKWSEQQYFNEKLRQMGIFGH